MIFGFTSEAGRPHFLQADGEGKGKGFYIIDNPLGKRGPPRFACEAFFILSSFLVLTYFYFLSLILILTKSIGLGTYLAYIVSEFSSPPWTESAGRRHRRRND